MPEILIVADDLTGALDASVLFAARGMATVVARSPEDVAAAAAMAPAVLGVSTGSREASREAAAQAVRRALAALPGPAPRFVFKKVDSRLKGHVGAETRALAARLDRWSAFLCPAVPDLGRTVVNGAVVGSGVARPIPLAGCGFGDRLVVQAPDVGGPGEIEAGLAAMVAPGAEERFLLVGARGLAEAVARRLRPATGPRMVARLPGPLVMAIGSRDPITLAQIEHLRSLRDVADIAAPGGELPASDAGAGRALLVRITAGDREVPAALAGAAFARGVAAQVRSRPPGTLFACGGETANGVLAALGCGVLEVLGEAQPGIPVARLADGRRTTLVTKSGGFGAADALTRLVDAASETMQGTR